MSNQKYDTNGNIVDELADKEELKQDDFCNSQELLAKGEEVLKEDKCACADEYNYVMHKLNFVDQSDRDLLLFVQSSIREKNILEKELETIETTYDDELANIKTGLLDSEEVTKYSTQKERLLKLDKLAEEQIDSKYSVNISKLKEKIYEIKNELDLAREIYRLKNI